MKISATVVDEVDYCTGSRTVTVDYDGHTATFSDIDEAREFLREHGCVAGRARLYTDPCRTAVVEVWDCWGEPKSEGRSGSREDLREGWERGRL